MGLGYSLKILEHFYEDPDGRRTALSRRTAALTRAISMETAGFLDISTATVITDTRMARAWLHTELQRRAAETSP